MCTKFLIDYLFFARRFVLPEVNVNRANSAESGSDIDSQVCITKNLIDIINIANLIFDAFRLKY